jgi:hypothetical protein
MSEHLPCPPAPPRAPTHHERRTAERIYPETVFRCDVRTAAGTPLRAVVLDISSRGAGLLLYARLERGATLTLSFSRGRSRPPLAVPAHVVYCAEQDRGASVLGCAFAGELTAAELRAVLP